MTLPLPLSTLKPATRDVAEVIGRSLVFATGSRRALLERLYGNMTPAAKARADYASLTVALDGGQS